MLDELDKIAVARKRMTVAQSRKGRRSMRVDTMLRKEKDGTLYKKAGKYGKNSAGYDLQGEVKFQGIPVAIENRKGSVRKGKNEDGTEWKIKYKIPYGYIKGTKGADGDEVDAYVGPKKDADQAFVVHQKKDNGKYDEDTVMLGFKNKAEAKKAILAHYDDSKYIGKVMPVSMERLKAIVKMKKRLTKLASSEGSSQAEVDYREGDDLGAAKLQKRKGDVPSRDKTSARKKKGDVPSREGGSYAPKSENRQDAQGTILSGPFVETGGYNKPSEY